MKKSKFAVCIFTIVYAVCLLVIWMKPDGAFSVTERRKLTQKPQLTVDSLLQGTYMEKAEEYVTDQFPARDFLRTVKASFQRYILQSRDNNGIYCKDGYLAKMEYPISEESIAHASEVFNGIHEKYLEKTDVKPYLCVIPDKNNLLAGEEYPAFDYDDFAGKIKEGTSFARFISVYENLELSDYYKTDSHWRQEKITDIADGIAEEMGISLSGEYEQIQLETPFYGVYYGQMALPIKPDRIGFCTNSILDQCIVYDHENGKEIPMYDITKAEGRDPYELFLGGNISLVTIENPNAVSQKELVVFGDSFARSLVPLLAEGYAKTTLVDIRYLPSASVGKFISFENQDVLFIYSTSVLNNSITLK